MPGPPHCRLFDLSMVPMDGHGCPGCPHCCVGPAILGSFNVAVEMRPAIAAPGHMGIHAACCDGNFWMTLMGSATVKINGLSAVRQGDVVVHCGGIGMMITGSGTVMTG